VNWPSLRTEWCVFGLLYQHVNVNMCALLDIIISLRHVTMLIFDSSHVGYPHAYKVIVPLSFITSTKY